MIERIGIAIALVAAIPVLGALVRARVNRRTRAFAVSSSLGAAERPRLLVFSTRFCGECAAQRSLVESAARSWGEMVQISFHDAAKERELAGRFGILTVPALVFADASGRVRDIHHGLTSEDRLRSLVESAA